MTIPRVVRGAARALSKESEYESSAKADEGRTETVSAIQRALRERAAARRRRRFVVPAVAAIAVAAAVAFAVTKLGHDDRAPVVTNPPTPSATAVESAALTANDVDGNVSIVSASGATTTLAKGASFHTGDRVVSTEGSATITLPSGSHVQLERATNVRLDIGHGAQVVELASGAVTSHVMKVAPDDRFLVRSGDVDVEVRGTVFRVERSTGGACASQTKVSVTEGRVVIRARGTENVLGAGDAWESACAEPASRPSATTAKPTASAPRVPASTEPVVATSDLSAQNTMFAEAMAAKSRGDTTSAVSQLDAFLLKYPNSPLHEAAAAQRMRLLATSDPTRAANAAREYIARYPNGFARAEAERIAKPNEAPQPQK